MIISYIKLFFATLLGGVAISSCSYEQDISDKIKVGEYVLDIKKSKMSEDTSVMCSYKGGRDWKLSVKKNCFFTLESNSQSKLIKGKIRGKDTGDMAIIMFYFEDREQALVQYNGKEIKLYEPVYCDKMVDYLVFVRTPYTIPAKS